MGKQGGPEIFHPNSTLPSTCKVDTCTLTLWGSVNTPLRLSWVRSFHNLHLIALSLPGRPLYDDEITLAGSPRLYLYIAEDFSFCLHSLLFSSLVVDLLYTTLHLPRTFGHTTIAPNS